MALYIMRKFKLYNKYHNIYHYMLLILLNFLKLYLIDDIQAKNACSLFNTTTNSYPQVWQTMWEMYVFVCIYCHTAPPVASPSVSTIEDQRSKHNHSPRLPSSNWSKILNWLIGPTLHYIGNDGFLQHRVT